MQLTDSEIIYIKRAFQKMKSKDDFLALLNYCKEKIYGENTKPFKLAQINYNAFINTIENKYQTFEVNKKAGGTRVIMAPRNGLKAIQKSLNLIFQSIFIPDDDTTGFVKNRSVVDNARKHVGSIYVYNLDLKDFFPSIDQARVWRCLQNPPFFLSPKFKKMELANLIVALCCVEMEVERKDSNDEWMLIKKRVLPQGAPTSPILSNVVCQKLDFLLGAVARRFGLRYSRYADDITFSSMHNVYQREGEFVKEVYRIIADQNFHVKESKVRLQKDGYRQEVTGLVVNKKVNVNKRYVKQLRVWLYLWKTYGFSRAENLIWIDYTSDKGYVKQGTPKIPNLIHGKLEYLKMVKGEGDNTYKQLRDKFKLLNDEFILEKKNSINEDLLTKDNPHNIIEYSDHKYQRSNTVRVKDILYPHTPLYTVSFLQLFKFGDGKGFKELVHDVELDTPRLKIILDQVKRHPNFIDHYFKERLPKIQFLNKQIQLAVIDLIDIFESNAKKSLKKNLKHPFNNISVYTNFALNFKRRYRYGSGREYSKLKEDIINVIDETKASKFPVEFLPSDERSFALRGDFFTWQPSVYQGLKYIFEGIRDHSNINGLDFCDYSKKTIRVICERKKDSEFNFVEVSILDLDSKCNHTPEILHEYLKGSKAFKEDFRNICDWSVEADFIEGESKRFDLLITDSADSRTGKVISLPTSVGGFKHILKFYEIL
ncbi:hypothetical protein BH11BAC2_BH11BAC2_06260 [soil metagenome]